MGCDIHLFVEVRKNGVCEGEPAIVIGGVSDSPWIRVESNSGAASACLGMLVGREALLNLKEALEKKLAEGQA